MKQSWTRLARMTKGHSPFREAQFKRLFVAHHKNAQEIIFNKAGEPLAAIYITPIGSHQEQTKAIFKMIADRMQYECERDNNG